jgi:enamine deaminase RidA (YjgF/YER057c/UK114 family)
MKNLSLLLVACLISAEGNAAADAGRTYYPAPNIGGAVLPFSQAVLVDKTLYTSGHLGFDPATGKLGTTPTDEAKLALDAVKSSLQAAGMTMADLVSVQVFCTDMALATEFNKLYSTYFRVSFRRAPSSASIIFLPTRISKSWGSQSRSETESLFRVTRAATREH